MDTSVARRVEFDEIVMMIRYPFVQVGHAGRENVREACMASGGHIGAD